MDLQTYFKLIERIDSIESELASMRAELDNERPEGPSPEPAFTCPECGGHWFGTDSGGGRENISNWVVCCHGQHGPCFWSGPYEKHVSNDLSTKSQVISPPTEESD